MSSRVIAVDAPAKVNLFLGVGSRRQDGMHNIESIMQAVSLKDRLLLRERSDDRIEVICRTPGVPCNEGNLGYRAAALLRSRFNLNQGVTIEIVKEIPVAAGLAGGSADAAGVLVGLNTLWGLDLSLGELLRLSAELGADVPFSILGGTALATGLGERVFPLESRAQYVMILVKPPVGLSTPEVYRAFDWSGKRRGTRDNALEMAWALKTGDVRSIARSTYNDLEGPALMLCPEAEHVKKNMMKTPLLGVTMSGSGPTFFGLCPNKEIAESVLQALKQELPDCFVALAEPVDHGALVQREGKEENTRWKP